MSHRSTRVRRFTMAGLAVGATLALGLTGCAGPGGGSTAAAPSSSAAAAPEFSQADIDAALEKPTQLTFWAWGPQYQAEVDAFMAKYPNVKITLVNNGAGVDQYTKLQNVVKAGSGIPDVAQIEFTVMPQFALGKSLVDLADYSFADMEKTFTSSSWTASNLNGAIYGLPQDAGPMAMFYRADVFEKFGLEVPKTWDEYAKVAEDLKAADPSRFITADAGDANFTSSMIWQAGGNPYKSDGTDITVDLQDKGSKRFADMWGPLVEKGLVDTATPGFTPEWNAGLASGKYATLVTGAWAAGTLQRRIPDAVNVWKVAPMPQYDGDKFTTAQTGGSLSAVMEASTNKLAAAGFVQWMAGDPEAAKIWVSLGGFPCTAATTQSAAWLDVEVPYFGGQKINQVFAQSAESVPDGWQFLPFQLYANSVYPDTVGQAYVGKGDLNAGLKAWQKSITAYGNSQGFTVDG